MTLTSDRTGKVANVIELDRRVQRVVRRHSADAWMTLNLTVPQVKTLFYVSNQPGTSPTRLAAALGSTPPNVTGIVDRLVEQGLLLRQDSPEDRRALVLRTTEKAEAILSGLRERRTDVLREILKHLENRDLSLVVSGLSKLAAAARAYEESKAGKHD